jgi:hypothetical protein
MSQLNDEQWIFYRISRDGGEHWENPIKIDVKPRTVLGPGHGIQIQSLGNKNRLLIPAYTPTGCYSIISDDGGNTWTDGETNQYGNENSLVELQNGTVYMSVRTKIPVSSVHDPLERLYSLSHDGGQTWTYPKMHAFLPDPIVMSSVVRIPNSINTSTSQYVCSLPGSYTSRVKLTLYLSEDGCQTWNSSRIIYFGPSGYSELGVLSDYSVICFFENGRVEYSDQLVFIKVSPNWIKNGEE